MKEKVKTPKKHNDEEKVQVKDPVKEAQIKQEERALQRKLREKFQREWKLLVRGPSLSNYEYTVITQALQNSINKAKDLAQASRDLSHMLTYELGYQHWNVIIVQGPFSRKTYCSGGYFTVFQRIDGTQAIIWLNKLTYKDNMGHSIVNESQYF